MKTKQFKELLELLNPIANSDIDCYISKDEIKCINDFDDFFDTLQGNGYFYSIEAIYYHKAIKYLSENDASLSESLEIADELGYNVKDINSELLATLLMQQKETELFYEMRNDIEKIING
jgi:hypothetical protein